MLSLSPGPAKFQQGMRLLQGVPGLLLYPGQCGAIPVFNPSLKTGKPLGNAAPEPGAGDP